MTITYVGSSNLQTSGTGVRTITPHASTLDGDLLIVIGAGTSAGSIGAPAGWTALKASALTGTLASACWVRARAPGDASYSFTVSANMNTSHLCLTFRDWTDDLADLIISSIGTRATSGGTFTTTAPTVNTVSADNTVLVIGVERTTTTETGISSVNNSFTQLEWLGHGAGGIETIFVGTKNLASAGATGATNIVYPNTQANNAAAWHLAIPAGIPVPSIGFSWFNSTEPNAIRCGWSTANVTSARMVVSQSSDLSDPVYSDPGSPSASGWLTLRTEGLEDGNTYFIGLEADGDLLDDGRLQGRTLTTGPLNYKFLTGSCQFTGSNHVVFDTMKDEGAEFFIHQGDLHYANTGVEATWRAAFTSSMTATKFAEFIATLPMPYTWDNHDWAGQGFEADDWDNTVNPQAFIRELSGDYVGTTEIYRTFVHGRVRFIQTDQWSERDPDEASESASKRCMSDEQEQWLYATLEAAEEPIIIWATLWPLYRSTGNGRWGSYTTQRNRIKQWLIDHPLVLDKMIGIGGDSHGVQADTGVNQDALGLWPTLNSSPFNQTGAAVGGTWDIVNFDTVDADGYYSRVTITDDVNSITMLWESVDQDLQVIGSYERTWETPGSGLPVTLWVWDGDQLVTPTDIFPA